MKKSVWFGIILGCIFFSFVVFAYAYVGDFSGFGSDSGQYWDLAGNLLHGSFSFTNPQGGFLPNTIRLPAYPALLSLGRLVYDNLLVAHVLNILLFVGSVFFSYRIGSIFLPKKQLSWYLLVLVFCPLFLENSGISTELIACFFASGFLLGMVSLFYEQRFYLLWSLFSIVMGSAALLTRSNVFVYLFVIVFGFFLFSIVFAYWKKTLSTLVVAVVFGLVYVGYSLHIKDVSGTFGLSTHGGYNLYLNYLYYENIPNKPDLPKIAEQFRAQGGAFGHEAGYLNTYLTSYTTKYLVSHPGLFLKKTIFSLVGIFVYSYHDATHIYGNLFASELQKANFIAYGAPLSLGAFYKGTTDAIPHSSLSDYVALLFFVAYQIAKIALLLLCVLGCFWWGWYFFFEKKKSEYAILLGIVFFACIGFLMLSAVFGGLTAGNRLLMPILPVLLLFGFFAFSRKSMVR